MNEERIYTVIVAPHVSEKSAMQAAPQLFFGEIAGFKTSSRLYLLKYGVPRHPDVIDR